MDSGHLGQAFHGGNHYENFPVASWLLPAGMRQDMLALYRFARTGDDLADEGELAVAARRQGLDALHAGLIGSAAAAPHSDALAELQAIGDRLRESLVARGIGVGQAQRLLHAFRMDAAHSPMASEADVLDYCSHSANPVGRLVLAFANIVADPDQDTEATRLSDAICSGLQLVNFAQDLGEDFSRKRIYIPSSWWPQGWTPDLGAEGLTAQQKRELARRMAQWGKEKIQSGGPLIDLIKAASATSPRRLALEIALVIEGGTWISEQVLRQPLGVWQESPRLSKSKLPVILLRALKTFFKTTERT